MKLTGAAAGQRAGVELRFGRQSAISVDSERVGGTGPPRPRPGAGTGSVALMRCTFAIRNRADAFAAESAAKRPGSVTLRHPPRQVAGFRSRALWGGAGTARLREDRGGAAPDASQASVGDTSVPGRSPGEHVEDVSLWAGGPVQRKRATSRDGNRPSHRRVSGGDT